MASSHYHLPGAFHSRVYRSNVDGAFFILIPDVKPGDPGRFETQVFRVQHDPRSDLGATYQVFRMGDRRTDLEVGLRIAVGTHWGTHTIIEPGSTADWNQIEQFKTKFQGTGCLLAFVAIPAVVLSVGTVHALSSTGWL
jgi:hypothetical protein